VPINPRVSISDREKLKQFSACYKVPPGLPCEETRERPWDAKFRFAIALMAAGIYRPVPAKPPRPPSGIACDALGLKA